MATADLLAALLREPPRPTLLFVSHLGGVAHRMSEREDAHEIREAIRFSEDYGYNKWLVAQDALTRIQAHVEALTEERDRWNLIADETSKAAVETLAHVEALEGALRELRYNDVTPDWDSLNIGAALAGEPDKGGAWTHGYSGESEEWVKGPTTTDEHGRKVFTMHRGESEPPTTCPTCGSKKRGKRRWLTAPFGTARCDDPWHTVPTGTAHAPGTCCTALDCPSCVPPGTTCPWEDTGEHSQTCAFWESGECSGVPTGTEPRP